ncbi:WD40/YVTN/BNR-like repeat-containing protein [Hymenobacter properus]|uniref:Photosynthesis system II assembly factor Ycf48/Hcf136-like domain-containing protein n=1 Tax=Hymenobacter properus TaxID=2791026 RepID=A0A931BE50_9BACT|nr:hypothetical protein [Hymenobacter properus]MBF9140006.1 hypothetical protein [Hymenobacter properus]MBR7718813.1 hypothetical protein [Microvirga sp. SRT04]
MKAHCFLILATFLVLTGCKKENESPTTPRTVATALPFENAAVKVELVANNLPTWIQAMTFLDASVGIVCTYDGKVYRTSDGGRSWSLQYSVGTPTQLPLLQILFTSARVGYIVGGSVQCTGSGCTPPGGLVLKTTDAGITWAAVHRVNGAALAAIAVNSVGDLFAVANTTGSQIIKSSDAGATWTPVASWPYQLNKIAFDLHLGYGASGNSGSGGNAGKIIRSLEDGASWSEAATFAYPYLNELAFGPGIGFCASGYSIVYKTTNDGANWTPITSSNFSAQVITPLTATNCLIFGSGTYSGGDFGTYSGSLRQSEDAGNSWSEIELKTVGTIRQASFYSAQSGYALAGSTLLKITVK